MCKRHQSERNNENIRPQRAELMPKIKILKEIKSMKTKFADQLVEKVFINYVVEHDYTKNSALVEHKTIIKNEAIKKMAKKMYYSFKDKMDHESFLNEFQTQFWLESTRYAKSHNEIDLCYILNELEEPQNIKPFLFYMTTVIKGRILDTYIQSNETLTDKFQDKSYYDSYFKEKEETTTNPVLKWYYKNKESILTKTQIQFLDALNKGTAVEAYSKQDISNRKRRIMNTIAKAYEEEFGPIK